MLVVSIDGLRPVVVRRLGKTGAPTLTRLIRHGASTLNARTAVEDTRTLPNHTTMITGRPVARHRGGHGVDVNTDPGVTVHDGAGEHVSSVFQVAARRCGRPALFASKDKFALFQRTWQHSIARFTYLEDNTALTSAILRDLHAADRGLRFVHFSAPDVAGHEFGFNSPRYYEAVHRTDRELGRLVRYVAARAALRSRLVLVITADHGGSGRDHDDRTEPANFTIPFIAWGAGVARGADLYQLNPERREPGRARIGYRGRQPIRNGDLANLVLDILGLPPVPGSRINDRQTLDLRYR